MSSIMTILNMGWLEFLLNICGLTGLTQAVKSLFNIEKAKSVILLAIVAFVLSWLRYKSGFWYVVTRDTLVFAGLAGALWDFLYSKVIK